jgi:hypothetical protein
MKPEPTYNGKGLSEWLRLAKDQNFEVRETAIEALAKMPSEVDGKVLPVLREHIWHPVAFRELWHSDREFARAYASKALSGKPTNAAHFANRFAYLSDPDPSWLPQLIKIKSQLPVDSDGEMAARSIDEAITYLQSAKQ